MGRYNGVYGGHGGWRRRSCDGSTWGEGVIPLRAMHIDGNSIARASIKRQEQETRYFWVI